MITVIPGEIASSSKNNTPCTSGEQPAGNIIVTANGGLSAKINTYVLNYGCIYQGGFIYSIDDTTPNTGSIGGKTAAKTDTFPGQVGPFMETTPNWGGSGIDIGPALYEDNERGANDGSMNSADIIQTLNASVPSSEYAAGLCSTLSVDISGASSCSSSDICYTNWYLAAICELGAAQPQPNTPNCIAGSTNIQQQLFEFLPTSTLGLVDEGSYWSSTEYSVSPSTFAWIMEFNTTLGSVDGATIKTTKLGVRCSRALTP